MAFSLPQKNRAILCAWIAMTCLVLTISWGRSSEAADGKPDEIAVEFVNRYAKVAPTFSAGDASALAWIAKQPVVTERFRKGLTRLYRDARKSDPEAGYGSDAILGGQDFPDSFRVLSSTIEGDKAKVVLIGTDPGFPMEVKVALIQTSGKWFVDGSGDLYY
jgi:hypothetical protein